MTTEEKTALDQLLHAIDDLAAMVQYYCIGVYGIRDSFLDASSQPHRVSNTQTTSAGKGGIIRRNYHSDI
jgi:hypothetical protein